MSRGRLVAVSVVSLALLAACSGSTAQEGAPSVAASTSIPTPFPTDTFPALEPTAFADTVAAVDTGTLGMTEGETPTLTADFVRALAADDPALLAIADAIASSEAAAFEGALVSTLTDTELGEAQSLGQVGTPDVAAPSASGGRGSSVAVAAAVGAEDAGDTGKFGDLAAINWALAELFTTYLPEGASVAGQGSDTVTKDGTKAVIGMDVDLASSGASTFGMSADVTVEPTPDRKGRGQAGIGFKATVDPCPDPDGNITLQFSARLSADLKAGATNATRSAEISGLAIGHVDDSAHLAGVDLEAQHKASGTNAAGKGIFVDSTDAFSLTGLEPGGTVSSKRVKAPTLNSESQEVDYQSRARVHQEGIDRAVNFAFTYLRGLEASWREGKCVAVQAQSPGRVQPGAVTPIPVNVVHKPTGTALSVPVDATLSGPEGIDPTRIEKSPGTITHTASGEATSKASIELISTSKRGIGRTTVTITVGSLTYTASGGGPRISVSGTVSDLTKPFTLQGQGSGFTVVFQYTPSSPDGRSGSLVYSGEGGGATLEGTGSYTIEGEEGGVLTMTATNQGCASPGGCRSNTETITLTPIE